jgi:hypothetical protein
VTPAEVDPALRRFERDAAGACLVTALVAFGVAAVGSGVGPALRVGLGVIGGGLLTALSYRAIKGGVDVVMRAAGAVAASAPEAPGGAVGEAPSEPDPGPPRGPVLSVGRKAFFAVKFFTRYALLAIAAYVMLTCFRLHPVGLVAGATAPFLAAAVQAGRLSRASGQRPRR